MSEIKTDKSDLYRFQVTIDRTRPNTRVFTVTDTAQENTLQSRDLLHSLIPYMPHPQLMYFYRLINAELQSRIVPICQRCGVHRQKMKKCGGCKMAHYCSVACQRAHRAVHRSECSIQSPPTDNMITAAVLASVSLPDDNRLD